MGTIVDEQLLKVEPVWFAHSAEMAAQLGLVRVGALAQLV
jgi:hypothetical protein